MTKDEIEAIREIASRANTCGDVDHEIVVAGDAYTNCCDRGFDREEIALAMSALTPLLAEVERLRELVACPKCHAETYLAGFTGCTECDLSF